MKAIVPKALLILCLALCCGVSDAQLASGLHMQRYAGVHGVLANPAAGLHGDLAWDINLASLNVHLKNDYLHVKNASWLTIFRGNADLSLSTTGETPADSSSARIGYYRHERRPHRAYVSAHVMGPSVWWSRQGIGIGLMTSYRAAGDVRLPASLGYDRYTTLADAERLEIEPIRAHAATWSEYALHVSTDRLQQDGAISIGANLKYLRPHESTAAYVDGTAVLTKTDASITLDSTVGILQLSEGLRSGSPRLMTSRGYGWGLDLGISYQTEFYQVGASITDVGQLSIQSGAEHRWVISAPTTLSPDAVETDLSTVATSIDQQLGLDSSITRSSYRLYTPTALRLSYDQYLSEDTYVSAEWRQPLAIDRSSLRSTPTMAVSWRREKRWWSVTGSAILTDYRDFALGVGARLGPVTIGTDDLLSLATRGRLDSGSVYLAVKINPYSLGGKGESIPCPKVKRSPFDSGQTVRGARRMGVYSRQGSG